MITFFFSLLNIKKKSLYSIFQLQFSPQAPQGPAFQEKFGDQTVEAEGTIRLVAKIRGVPAPDVTWSRWVTVL